MGSSHTLANLLWLSALIFEAGILVVLFRRGLHKQYPRFSAYILLQIVSELFLTFVQGRFPYTYYYGYWVSVAASVVLTLAVLYEIVERLYPPADARRKSGIILLGWLAVGLIIGLSILSEQPWPHFDSIPSIILSVDRGVRFAICGVGLFVLVLCKLLRVSSREFVVGVVAGFVLFSGVHLLVAMALSNNAATQLWVLTEINSAAYVLAALIWLLYAIWSPKTTLGGATGTPPSGRSWPGGPAYALRSTEPR